MNGTTIGKIPLLVAGLLLSAYIFDRCSSFGIWKINGKWIKFPLEMQNDWRVHHLKKRFKRLKTTCAKSVSNLQRRTSWNAYGARVDNIGDVQR